MNAFLIRLQNVADVDRLVAMTTCRKFPVYISDGNNTVDSTNFMELFCLNLTQPVCLTAHCSNDEFEQLIRDIDFLRAS